MSTLEKPRRGMSIRGPSPEVPPCQFCAIAAGHASHWPDRVLFATESYVVIASIGALVPGWAMVVPRRHTLNLGDAFSDPEFSEVRLRIAGMLAKAYPSTTIRLFEHGAQTGKSHVGCGVDHAHLHLVPLRMSLVPWLRTPALSANWQCLSLSSVPEAVHGREYLLYSDDAGSSNPRCWVSLPVHPVSQFFRRILAVANDTPEQYDYRAHPFLDNVVATQASLTRTPMGTGTIPGEHENTDRLPAEGWS